MTLFTSTTDQISCPTFILYLGISHSIISKLLIQSLKQPLTLEPLALLRMTGSTTGPNIREPNFKASVVTLSHLPLLKYFHFSFFGIIHEPRNVCLFHKYNSLALFHNQCEITKINVFILAWGLATNDRVYFESLVKFRVYSFKLIFPFLRLMNSICFASLSLNGKGRSRIANLNSFQQIQPSSTLLETYLVNHT